MIETRYGFVKINTDASLNSKDEIIDRDMVVRDDNYKVIFIAASPKIEVYSMLCAELDALLWAVNTTYVFGWSDTIFEFGHLIAINIFKDSGPYFSLDDLIVDEIRLLFMNRNFHFHFRPHEQNAPIQFVVKFAIGCVIDMVWWSNIDVHWIFYFVWLSFRCVIYLMNENYFY